MRVDPDNVGVWIKAGRVVRRVSLPISWHVDVLLFVESRKRRKGGGDTCEGRRITLMNKRNTLPYRIRICMHLLCRIFALRVRSNAHPLTLADSWAL